MTYSEKYCLFFASLQKKVKVYLKISKVKTRKVFVHNYLQPLQTDVAALDHQGDEDQGHQGDGEWPLLER